GGEGSDGTDRGEGEVGGDKKAAITDGAGELLGEEGGDDVDDALGRCEHEVSAEVPFEDIRRVEEDADEEEIAGEGEGGVGEVGDEQARSGMVHGGRGIMEWEARTGKGVCDEGLMEWRLGS